MLDRVDWKEYVWLTYRGRVALGRRWYQRRNTRCATCGKLHIGYSTFIVGVKLTPEEIKAYEKGVKNACKIGKNIKDFFKQ